MYDSRYLLLLWEELTLLTGDMLQGLKPGWYVAVGPGALNATIVVVVIENKKTLRFCCSCFNGAHIPIMGNVRIV